MRSDKIILHSRFIQLGTRRILSYLFLFLISGCSTIPNNSTTSMIEHPQITNPKLTVGDFIVQSATSQIGVRYQYGGQSPSEGFDCSGLVVYSHQLNGITVPRKAAEQFKLGKQIKSTELNSGDLLFFKTMGQAVSHVGIYMGNNLFIHSPNSRKNVQTETLSNPYYKARYLGARRYW